ncbi:MAG: bifunctional hydroxymethylpyrimidine kinase/phosphomethylpyrimidine kinase [Phycisphaerae bacterium]
MQTALTIAGSDSIGGAGIQADLKTFTVLGVYGMSVITAVTAQNTSGVSGVELIPAEMIAKQIDAVATDFPVHAFKTGMLANAEIIDTVAEGIRKHSLENYVCDPVVFSKTGAELLDASAIHTLRKELLPLATVVTPNRAEAAMLANMDIGDVVNVAGAERAAEKIMKTGVRSVVVKGINLGDRVVDVFYDGDRFREFPAKRLKTNNTHGSGCLFSAAITAMLAQETELLTAIDHARSFVSQAIEHHVKLGNGVRPVNALALIPH